MTERADPALGLGTALRGAIMAMAGLAACPFMGAEEAGLDEPS